MTSGRHDGSQDDASYLAPTDPTVYDITPGRHRKPVEPRRGNTPRWVAILAATAVAVVGLAQLLPEGDQPHRRAQAAAATFATLAEPTVTLQGPGSPATSVATAATPRPTVAPTSPIGEPAPPPSKPNPEQPPTRAAPGTPGTSAPTKLPAVLSVSTSTLTLTRQGGGSSGNVWLTASGGPVSWTATALGEAAEWLYLDDSSGTLLAGESNPVGIAVDPNSPASVTELQVVFDPGALIVTVLITD